MLASTALHTRISMLSRVDDKGFRVYVIFHSSPAPPQVDVRIKRGGRVKITTHVKTKWLPDTRGLT